jgi:hypothetical protein
MISSRTQYRLILAFPVLVNIYQEKGSYVSMQKRSQRPAKEHGIGDCGVPERQTTRPRSICTSCTPFHHNPALLSNSGHPYKYIKQEAHAFDTDTP